MKPAAKPRAESCRQYDLKHHRRRQLVKLCCGEKSIELAAKAAIASYGNVSAH